MYIDIVPNRKSRPTVLIREAWRDGKRIRKRTIANITDWPEEKVSALRLLLRGERLVRASEAITIERSVPCGHVRAVLRMANTIGLHSVISQKPSLHRNIVLGLVVEQLLLLCAPHLAERLWERSVLAEDLGVTGMHREDFMQAVKWLRSRRPHIEAELASRHPDRKTLSMDTPDDRKAPGILVDLADLLGRHMASALSPIISDDRYDPARQAVPGHAERPAWTRCLSLCPGGPAADARAMSLGEVLVHLASQCLISCRITSIPGAPTYLALSRPTPLQMRVRELMDSYGVTRRREPFTWSSFRGFNGIETAAPLPASGRDAGEAVFHGESREANDIGAAETEN